MKTVKDIFYFVEDVMTITGLSRSKSYKIIADLNRELSDRGYCVIPGRIAKSYFHERYCYTQEVAAKAAARQTRAASGYADDRNDRQRTDAATQAKAPEQVSPAVSHGPCGFCGRQARSLGY